MRIKTDEYFRIFYEAILLDAKSLTDEPSQPRTRKPSPRFADSLPTSTVHQTIYDVYHHQYFDVINKIINSLKSRFEQSVFPLLCKVEQFILSTANGTHQSEYAISLNDIEEFLVDDIDVERLQRELTMLSDYLSIVNKENSMGLKRTTKISTICELWINNKLVKLCFVNTANFYHYI